jgi:uncharacterized membrane protein
MIRVVSKTSAEVTKKLTRNENSKRIIAYLVTARSIWYWVTLIITMATAIAVYVIPTNIYPWTFLRNVLGVIFVFFLPGYVFIKVTFPNKVFAEDIENLDIIIRIAFSIGISIAIVSILGLILYYTPFGLDLTPIVFSLLFFTVILATLGAIKESRVIT